MPTFPLTTSPLIRDFNETYEDAVLRSDFDAGYQQTRPKWTRTRRKFTASYLVTQSQKATLHTFYVTTLANGALSFDWTHPQTGSVITVRMDKPITFTPVSNSYWIATISMTEV